jgi:mercuric ion binding protein
MKKFILSLVGLFTMSTIIEAQTPIKKTETVKIYGNCNMCKSTIEGALKKKDGVLKKDWNTETKILTVTYDSTKITLNQILQKVADVGYDSDTFRAKDETYNKLAKCCHYERPKK